MISLPKCFELESQFILFVSSFHLVVLFSELIQNGPVKYVGAPILGFRKLMQRDGPLRPLGIYFDSACVIIFDLHTHQHIETDFHSNCCI